MSEPDPTESYPQRLLADVLATAEADSVSTPEAFTRRILEELEQAGEVENTFVAHYAARGVEVSAHGTNQSGDSVDLFLAHFRQVPERLTRTQIETLFRRLSTFLDKCRAGLAQQLDDSSDIHDMAVDVAKETTQTPRVRLFLLTNAVAAVTAVPPEERDGLTVTHHVWDVARLGRLASSGTLSESIVVDFDPPLPCLGTPGTDSDFSVLLAILPGNILADLYGRHGTRLLELNVRSFLQGRGLVNKGIRQTLLHEPERFLAYNNGITATASHVEFTEAGQDGARLIRRVHDLQIVNGGQTTASLHHAHARDRADVARVQVQMKLTVVAPERLKDIVPEISRYSNTQNKVTVVDFSSNHPFHVAVEKVTRSLWAPATGGSGQETRWFYERARGAYADALARERTPAAQRRFKIIHPTSQKFTKSDAAKYLNSWQQLPHLVSRGAEKNFFAFMTAMGDAVPEVDATLCRRLIATAILFRATDRVVTEQQFGGYKINVVTYTVAKLSQATDRRVDLDRIWRDQALTPALTAAVRNLSVPVQQAIVRPLRGTNVGEWAKQPDCWGQVCDIVWSPDEELLGELTDTPTAVAAAERNVSDSSAVGAAASVPAPVWIALAAWARDSQNLAPWQRQLASTVGRYLNNDWQLSEKQAVQAVRLLEEARQLGFHSTPG